MRKLAFLVLPFLALACSAGARDTTDESDDAEKSEPPHLLAIGDSITFGWNPLIESDNKKVDARNYRGYAEILGKEKGWKVDNAACPGEASGSFLRADAKDNGCDANRGDYRLHTDWNG